MQRRARKLLSLICWSVALACPETKAASSTAIIPEYQIGETAKVDVVASVAIDAVDPEKTRALKQKEAQRPSMLYRVNTNATAEVLARLRSAFTTNREIFLTTLEAAYQQRKLDETAVSAESFHKLAAAFQNTNKTFPVSIPLARAWAVREPDEEYIAFFEQRLSSTMSRRIRPDRLPNEAKLNERAKLIFSDATTPLTVADAERARTREQRTNIIAIRFIQTNLANAFPPEEKVSADFTVSLLQPNCFPEVELTREVRSRFTEAMSSMNHFEAGDVIVRAGEVVDAAAKAALEELRAQTAILQLKEQPLAVAAAHNSKRIWVIATAAAAMVLIGLMWLRQRRHRTMALTLVTNSLDESTTVVKTDPVVRARLIEHLTRLLGESLVQRLFAQRGKLLLTQQTATEEAAKIEERLEKVQSDMQARFHEYEQRIADLEQELAAAEEENRDLIRAKITLAKQELDLERERSRLIRN
jgi:hypothetical protein